MSWASWLSLRTIIVALALGAAVEPAACPLLGLLHGSHACDCEHGDAVADPAGHDRSPEAGDEDHHRHEHRDGCEHCREHGHRLAQRPGQGLELPVALIAPTTISLPFLTDRPIQVVRSLRPPNRSPDPAAAAFARPILI